MSDKAKFLLILALHGLVIFAFVKSAPAQQPQPCGKTGKVEARIHSEYGESLVGAGIVPGGVLFTTMNPTTGSFTILLRRPDGQTCILMGGTGYAVQEPQEPPKPGVKL